MKDITEEVPENNYPPNNALIFTRASYSVKTHVNQSDLFEKLGFQDKIFSNDTIIFIPSKVLGDFKANKVK